MSLKAIKLPHFVIGNIYKNALLENMILKAPGPEKVKELAKQPSSEFKYLGYNEKNILILIDNQATDYLPDDELAFLINILTACKLTLADVAILNVKANAHFSCQQAINHFGTRVMLLINVEAPSIGLPFDFPHYQVQPFDSVTFLSCPSILEVKNDALQKSKLWLCLRKVFNV